MKNEEKLLAVESVRGIACFMVLMSHLSLVFFPYWHGFSGNDKSYTVQSFLHHSPFSFFISGTAAVYIFFVLSGYILSKIAVESRDPSRRIASMALKRYPRLMIPALASCLIACATFYTLGVENQHLSKWINEYGDFPFSFLGAFYSGSLDVFFLSGQSLYNPVLWTMKIELIGSFFIYIVCINKMRFRVRYLEYFCIAVIAAFIVTRLIDAKLGLGILSFYGGYLFSCRAPLISNKVALVLFILGFYFAGVHNGAISYGYIYQVLGEATYQLCNFVAGFLIVYATLFNKSVNLALSNSITVFMGKISFSVYLIHVPILATIGVLTFDLIFRVSNVYTLSAFVASLVTISTTYVCANFYYHYIDLQSMKISALISQKINKSISSITYKTNP